MATRAPVSRKNTQMRACTTTTRQAKAPRYNVTTKHCEYLAVKPYKKSSAAAPAAFSAASKRPLPFSSTWNVRVCVRARVMESVCVALRGTSLDREAAMDALAERRRLADSDGEAEPDRAGDRLSDSVGDT